MQFEMRIHTRLISIYAPADVVKSLTAISIDPNVRVEVTIAEGGRGKKAAAAAAAAAGAGASGVPVKA